MNREPVQGCCLSRASDYRNRAILPFDEVLGAVANTVAELLILGVEKGMYVNNLIYSKDGLAIREQFEEVRLQAYKNHLGIWTIGYGHTGPEVIDSLTITEEQANKLFVADIQSAADAVNSMVEVSLRQGEFDALVDFVFNIGYAAFAKSSMLRYLNEHNPMAVADEFEKWGHVSGRIVAGLLRRKQAARAGVIEM